MPLSTLVLWLLPAILQIGILVMMHRRGLRKQFTVFYTYTVYQVLSTLVLLAMYFTAKSSGQVYPYFYSYWTSNGLSAILGFLVVHEMFTYTIRPYVGLRDAARMIFQWAALIMLLVSAVVALSSPGSQTTQLTTAILTLERCVRLMQCGLLLFLICCSSYLGLSWKSFPIGVALGFSLVACSNLLLVSLQARFGQGLNSSIATVLSASYNLATIFWLGYAVMPQKVHARNEMVYRAAFDRWNQSALALQQVAGSANAPVEDDEAVTYISDIEHAVDDVLKHSRSNH